MRNLNRSILLVLSVTILTACGGSDYSSSPPKKPVVRIPAKVKKAPPTQKEIEKSREGKIVCDKFEVITDFTDDILTFSVDTDLPDDTLVMVSVSRSYKEKYNSDNYSLDYFKEKATIGKWKSSRRMKISEINWKRSLQKKQLKMFKIGHDLAFTVASISDEFKVRMVVPVRQTNPKFGDSNRNLIGIAVKQRGLRVVVSEIVIQKPMKTKYEQWNPTHPFFLQVGETYNLSKQTPMIVKELLSNKKKVIQLPRYCDISIYQRKEFEKHTMYEVSVKESRKPLGSGWINSKSLVGQNIFWKSYKRKK